MNLRQFLLSALLLVSTCLWAGQEERRFFVFDASHGLADNSAQTIACTKTGRMVITTIGHVNFFDGASFSHIDPTSSDIFPLPAYGGHYRLFFDKFHHLWLKDKYQVTCVNLTNEYFVTDVERVLTDIGAGAAPDDMFGDSDNHLWFLRGREVYSPEYQCRLPVSHNSRLHDVDVVDSSLVVQFFADGYVSVYDLRSGKHVAGFSSNAVPSDAAQYSRSSVAFLHDGLFYQIRNGERGAVLNIIDPQRRQTTLVMRSPYHLNNIAFRDGSMYVACSYGYWRISLDGTDREHVECLLLNGSNKLFTDVNTIAFDRQGGMWLGTERRGLLYSRPYTSPFRSYDSSQPEAARYARLIDESPAPSVALPRRTNCAFVDSRGWLWYGTYSGLCLLKNQKDKTRVYGRRDGLRNDMIHSIVEDDDHNLWVSTSLGISCLFISGDSVRSVSSYGASDNIPGESFVNGRAVKLADGTIVMQSLDHLVTFHPRNFHSSQMDSVRLYPKLTRLSVNGTVVEPGVSYDGHVILDRAVTRARELTVSYKQGNLLLTFSGLNYWRPEQTFYRLSVKGLENDSVRILSHSDHSQQVDSRGMLSVPLSGLTPGDYVISLQASMNPYLWLVEPLTWTIHVSQPWWRSTGIYLILALLLVTAVVLNFLLLSRNVRLKEKRNAEERDMLLQISNYVDRCSRMLMDERSSPSPSSADGQQPAVAQVPAVADASGFYPMMLSIYEFVTAHPEGTYTMGNLADACGLPLSTVYSLLSDNLYKSPKQFVQYLLERHIGEQVMK